MLLAIDVGNTHTVLGVWDDTRLRRIGALAREAKERLMK